MMTNEIQDEFEKIVKHKKVDPIYPFLKKLSHKERRALMPKIKKAGRYYGEFIQKGNSWTSRGTREQSEIIDIARFVCATGKEYERSGYSWLKKEEIQKIFEFYIPEWFGNYINNQSSKEGRAPFWMEYDWMMQLKNEGVLEPDRQLIVQLLPRYLYDSKQKKGTRQQIYSRNDSKLIRYPETLESHIWLFFEEESNIHWTDHYMNYNSPEKESLSWKQAFKFYADKGQIDRLRLLRASLSTANMNFNKSSSGWFIDLFTFISPTTEEMIQIQDDMLGVFNSPHSKPTNTVLKYFKKLCLENDFLIDGFLSNTPILLSSETKTTVVSTLMILDKLAKSHPRKAGEICDVTTQAFVSNDSAIQTRAAKIITKYGDPKDENLSGNIEGYADLLLTEANTLLAPFMSNITQGSENLIQSEPETTDIDVLSPQNVVEIPQTIDDLMFLASEAFDHNSELHLDVLPAALVNLNSLITADNADRFEPALQRAYKNIMGDWRAGMGLLDHMLCVFFIDYANMLIKRFSNGTLKLQKVRNVFREKEKENQRLSNNNTRYLFPFVDWFGKKDSKIYKPFYKKLLFVLEGLKSDVDLPILSTPTHRPHWIDPDVLIERVNKWQKKNVPLGHADLQFALSRTYLKDAGKSRTRLEADLKSEPKRVLYFLLDKMALPKAPFKTIAHWYTASITKNPDVDYKEFGKFVYSNEGRAKFTGDYTWQVGKSAFENSRWDYEKRKTVKFTDHRKMMKVDLKPKKKDAGFLGNVLNFKISPKPRQSLMLYEEIFLGRHWYEIRENDFKRFYGMFPNNPENLLAKICDKTLRYPEFHGETFKRLNIYALECLLTRQQPFGRMAHLLLSGSLICSDKTARSLAAELWVHGETHGLTDSSEIGRNIGKHFAVEFAPLKRFTDLVIESMVRISPLHSQQLLVMVENIVLTMNTNIVRGQKKLLEIYGELLRKNDAKVPKELAQNLNAWSSSKSLTKPIREIEKFIEE